MERKKFALVLIGPPASGKGTLGKRVAKLFAHCVYVETSDLLKKTKKPEVQSIMRDGGFVNDDLVITVLLDEITKHKEGNLVIDGTPRTPAQVIPLITWLQENRYNISVVVFSCPDSVCLSRASIRAEAEKTESFQAEGVIVREDSDVATTKRRLQRYRKNLGAIVSVFAENQLFNLTNMVDAKKKPAVIFGEVASILYKSYFDE